MTYLLLGDDVEAKDQKIAELKKRLFPSPDALKFDYEILYGTKLEADELKKALLALPVIASQRLVVIRAVHKSNAPNQRIIAEFIRTPQNHIVLVLDSDEADDRQGFVREWLPFVKVLNVSRGSRQNVFDVTNAMAACNPSQALKVLGDLLAQGDHPLQIMGAMVWFWGKSRPRLTDERFRQGLLELQETDLNIKRSRLRPEHALEMLVVRLSSLIAG